MTNFEKAKEIVENRYGSYEELYYGIAFLFNCGLISHEEYKNLMQILEG